MSTRSVVIMATHLTELKTSWHCL